MRSLLILLGAGLLLAGCESGLAYQANLGQTATLPEASASLGAPTAAGTMPLYVGPTTGGTLPDWWTSAQSLKLNAGMGYAPVSLFNATTSVYVANIPATFTKPLDGKPATMSALVNNERVVAVLVRF